MASDEALAVACAALCDAPAAERSGAALAEAQLTALRALSALLQAAASPAAAAATAEALAARDAWARVAALVSAPAPRCVAACQLLRDAAAACGPLPSLRDVACADDTLRALVCALGAQGDDEIAAAAAACLEALLRTWPELAPRLGLESHAGGAVVMHGAALPLLLALASHPGDAAARVLDRGAAPSAVSAAACLALDALCVTPAVRARLAAQPGCVEALVRALERASPDGVQPDDDFVRAAKCTGSLLCALLAQPAARAQVAAAPSLLRALAQMQANGKSDNAAAEARANAAQIAQLKVLGGMDEAHFVAAGACSGSGMVRLPSELASSGAAAFAAAVEREQRAKRAALSPRMAGAVAGLKLRAAASQLYDDRLMHLAVGSMDDDDAAALEAPKRPGVAQARVQAQYLATFAYMRAHVALRRGALLQCIGSSEAPVLRDALAVASHGYATRTLVPAAPDAPCVSHTLGLGFSAGMGGELLTVTRRGAWLGPLTRAVVDAAAAATLRAATARVEGAPPLDRGAGVLELREADAGCIAMLFAAHGAAVPPDAAAAAASVVWRFVAPTEADAATSDARLLMRPPGAGEETPATRFYMDFANLQAQDLYRVCDLSVVADVDESLAAAGAALQDALLALLCGGDAAHACCCCAACTAARSSGALCALPGCGVALRLRRCGRCQARAYCCTAHQAHDWARHKPECAARASAD